MHAVDDTPPRAVVGDMVRGEGKGSAEEHSQVVELPGWESNEDWGCDEECVGGVVFEAGVVFFAPGLDVFWCGYGHCGL